MRITLTDLKAMPLPDHVSINFMPIYGDPSDTDITLDYGGKKDTYSIRLTSDDITEFGRWVNEVVNK